MKTFICVFEPTTEARTNNGAVPLAIALNTANAKLATATAVVKLSEAYPEAMDNFNTDDPLISEHLDGSVCPTLDIFDEKFAVENEFDGTQWKPIEYKNFKKLGTKPRIACLLLFGKTQITNNEFSTALEYLAGKEDPKIRNIATGLAEITKLSLMDAEQTMEIAQAIYEFANEDVTVEEAKSLGESWLTEEPEQQQEETSCIKRNYSTIDTEIALALLDDFDPNNVLASQVKKAKELIDDDDKAWKRWSMDLRTTAGILDIPREKIFSLIAESKKQPELLDNPNARKEFIDRHLGINKPTGNTEKEESITSNQLDNTPSVSSKSTVEKETKPKRSRKKQEVAPKTESSPVVEQTVEPKEPETPSAQQDNFEQRASVIDEVLNASDANNLSIWKQVQRTDPRFTKPLEGVGFTGTSINSTYMFMRATEIFGPIGEGWGYEVLEEKFIDGKPLLEPVLDERNKQVATRFLRDADGSLFCEQNHSIKIRFWYIIECETRGEFESYGATPYRYQTNYGIKVDGEVIKKSLTDAIKKALSMLGFSSDVFMGMHDNPEYIVSNKLEFEIKNASEKAEDITRIRKELDEKFTKHTEVMRSAVTANELRGIASTLTREISAHIKSAKERRDEDYEKYLSGRLRRLNQIEKECLDKLKQKEEAI
ncbi:hypothetical protein [Proteus mirabilis]|jgi:hypothetical protein|uniref:hypothetical protein n=1 Tax=Proteus mirabilis TaxID=584 RepID=UPI000D74C63C|nr:hypothetical protein [Proteus mirabilis]AWR61182.1 hypothetical protein CLH65_18200 [Proteus mirabilis]MBB6683304.1 hypothetical protein [Proteus mirabilis]MBG5957486.1 hypothetical protein [Proteus mirabilis]MDF7250892.1 hypothetical protein [Proteus mirabilis]MDF7277393.1 hypothetical protein [Proteus mirabilis]